MFLVLAVLALQVQVTVEQKKATDSTAKGTTIAVQMGGHGRHRREAKRIPVTPELLASAYADPVAKALLARARVERMSQDSALASYEATTYQRISAGMGFSRIGRDRLIFRQESATHVRWQRGVGAYVDVTGARTAIPVAPEEAQQETRDDINSSDISPIPYFPGVEPLITFNGDDRTAQQYVDERDLVNPLAEGSEAYYTYATGDSLSYHLPDGHRITLRELEVRPRKGGWNVVIGSVWFDTATGQVVRAAYRMSEPMDIWAVAKEEDPHAMDDVPVWVKPMISPMHAQVNAIAIEYGLYQGRFWLPRMKTLEGGARVSFMRVPFRLEQSYRYSSVNAELKLQPIAITGPRLDTLPDSLREHVRDSLRTARREARDSVRRGLKPRPLAACDTAAYRTITRYRVNGALAVSTRIPCDESKLEHSPDLPPSIYDAGDEIFSATDRDALIAEARSMGIQPPLLLGHGALPPPTLAWGAAYMRYNRVEGFSLGGNVTQQIGDGYSASATGRLGWADLEPNLELSVARTNLVRTLRITGYNRLVSANDWGNPLSFGSSVSALLFGRDEGFYYRATGVELASALEQGMGGQWRLFAERERTATPKTTFSLGPAFIPNIVARRGTFFGGAYRFLGAHGEDPFGMRLTSDLRLEAATTGDSSYGRGALDLTVSHGLGGDVVGALTASGGSSLGALPPQRRWFLGGTQTIRGERPDTANSGNAYWFGRAELGRQFTGVRATLFGDLGWVGDRARMRDVGRPMSGVGTGASLLDGLIRFDIARGLYPQQRWRTDLYLEARF